MNAAGLSFEHLESWAETLSNTAQAAGRVIMPIYESDFEVKAKPDHSPVTAADQAAETVVLEGLAALAPAFPIVAEEQVAAMGYPSFDGTSFWLVDALDGTKEFVNHRGDFTVNIGFVHDGVPVLGVIYTPVRDETHVGIAFGGRRHAQVMRNRTWSNFACRKRPQKVVVTGSKSHQIQSELDAFLAKYDVAESIAVGSSLKFCMVAEGKADLYPRFGPTSEWDTAAGHAIVRAGGGRVHTFDGVELAYKKDGYRNGRFLAEGPV